MIASLPRLSRRGPDHPARQKSLEELSILFYKVAAITEEKIDLREIMTGRVLSIARVVEEVDVVIEDEGTILWARVIGSDENGKDVLFTNPLVFMKTSFLSAIEKNLDENYNRYRTVNEKEVDTASRYSKSSFLYWLEGIASQKLLKIYPASRASTRSGMG
jgi:hypothetical protein